MALTMSIQAELEEYFGEATSPEELARRYADILTYAESQLTFCMKEHIDAVHDTGVEIGREQIKEQMKENTEVEW